MRNRILLLLCFLCVGLQAFAQISISGKVVDAGGLELPGVNVMVKGTTVGTLTDGDGMFTIPDVPGGSNAVLVFSYVGFQPQEVKVGNAKNLTVKLQEDNMALDEVVVVGYGTSRKRDLAGSISSVKLDDSPLTQLANVNALVVLSSKIPGFSYAPTTSAGGDNTSSMTIRGMNSVITSVEESSLNNPLLVVDGSIFNGSINEIAMTDIESIDVLKDASSAAIYGSRSANGVIIITTKRGRSSKPTINLDAYYGVQSWSRKPKMVTDPKEFLSRRREAMIADGMLDPSVGTDAAQLLNAEEYEVYQAGGWIDWIDDVSQNAQIQNYNLSISGNASDKVNYYLSAGYMKQDGLIVGDNYKKLTFMAKLDAKVTDWLTVGMRASYYNASNPGQIANIQSATWLSPYSKKYVTIDGYTDWYTRYANGTTASPYWSSSETTSYLWTDRDRDYDNLNGTGFLQIDFPFLKGLSYKFTMNAVKNTLATINCSKLRAISSP
ncbi:MAG: SusC/RagA family TonB-linked outer membrane protein [Parabacteroides sp.]|nr:SusC/RagA family TonB-linked outer membrane protein [Parabacteroides sp.]